MIHWVLASGALDVIKFSIKTGTTTSTKKVILGNWTTPYDCIVDWGDGSTTKVTSGTQITHSYTASSTTYQIKITGKCGGFWNSSTRLSGYALVTSLDEVRSNSLKSLLYTFYNCTALTALPALINAPNLTDCRYAFYGCTANTSAYPKLWLTNPTASGGNCFTKCFAQTMYKQYGTKCPRIGAYQAGSTIPVSNCQYYAGTLGHYCESGTGPHYARYATCSNSSYATTYTFSCGKTDYNQCVGSGCRNLIKSGYYKCASPVGGISQCGSSCRIAGDFPEVQAEAVAAGWAVYA